MNSEAAKAFGGAGKSAALIEGIAGQLPIGASERHRAPYGGNSSQQFVGVACSHKLL